MSTATALTAALVMPAPASHHPAIVASARAATTGQTHRYPIREPLESESRRGLRCRMSVTMRAERCWLRRA